MAPSGAEYVERLASCADVSAIRDATIGDAVTKIETAMAGPVRIIDQELKQSASTADLAADRWRMFTRIFRWQQLTIAILFGVVMGAVGHWYFATRGPETEAAEYLLYLKSGIDKKATSAPVNPGSGSKSRSPRHRPSQKRRASRRSHQA